MEAYNPVVFKTIGRADASSVPAEDTLSFAYFNLEYCKPEKGNGYFLLVNPSDPTHPLKLYRSAMVKLVRQLPIAIKEAALLEELEEKPADNDLYDCGVINAYEGMTVRLVISTFLGHANIWLRLYSKLDDTDQVIPTKIGVRFSPNDSLEAMSDFLKNRK